MYELKQNESVKIKIANQKSKLIRAKERDYFSVLNQKLNWENRLIERFYLEEYLSFKKS